MSRSIAMALATVLVSATMVQAQQSSPEADAKQFAHQASMNNLFEIEAARMATVKTRSPDTGVFAQQVLNDQLKAQADLKIAAQEEGVAIPSKLDKAHEEKLQVLEEAAADRFDAVFYKTQVASQQSALKLLAAYGDKGERESLRAYAQSYFSTVKIHAAKARTAAETE